METLLYSNYKELVLNETPFIDVRAPIEFEKGAFKTSINAPILTDEERCQVGITYKNQGNDKATELGFRLVSGEQKEKRVETWVNYIEQHPEAMLYCFRGGSRSRIAQQWLKDIGIDIPRLEHGYKGFRNYLIESLTPEAITMEPLILGGCTGSGKTILLKKLENAIDLEKAANHRGSAFGRHVIGQPMPINFENLLAYEFIQKQEKGFQSIVLEDEGKHVGSCYLPKTLFEYTSKGKLVIMDVSLEKRVENTLEEYITEAQEEYIQYYDGDTEGGLEVWYEYITSSVIRVKKALGGDRVQNVLEKMSAAYAHQQATGDIQKHKEWILFFLAEYYDPMYQYQIETNSKEIIFRGTEDEVLAFLNDCK